MEFSGERTLWSFVDEEKKNINLPRRLSFGNHESGLQVASPRTSCASAASFPLWPISPETPWVRSPLHASPPTSSLLYHCVASLHRIEGKIFSIASSKHFVFTASDSRRIHAWKLPDCTEMGYIKANAGGIRAILAHGNLLFTAHGDYKIRVWDVPPVESFHPRKITTFPRRSFLMYARMNIHKDYISCIAYNHMENLLYTGSWDKTVKVWKIKEKQCVDSFVAHEGHVTAIVINPEDGCVFSGSSDGTVKIWRRVYRESAHILTMTLKFQPSPINALALSLSPSGCFLYSGSADGLINYWQKEKMSGRFNHSGFLQGHHFAVLCLVSIEDLILSGSEDATIRVWRREEGNSFHSCLAVIDGHQGPVKCLAASLETADIWIGLLVYSASLDQTFKVWRVKLYPAETMTLEKSDPKNCQAERQCQMSPVLSPSWVERKMQASHFE